MTRLEDLRGAARAICDVAVERERQISEEGWSPEHDDEHSEGELGRAAACYVLATAGFSPTGSVIRQAWPGDWDRAWLKLGDPRRMLVKAAALLIAEIERIDRAEESQSGQR